MDACLLGVAADETTLVLALRFPGTVMDSLLEAAAALFGVDMAAGCGPSLVDGLLPLDVAEAGRKGGGMLLSPLKKLDLRLPFFGAGEVGICDRLSMVRSESEGRLSLLWRLSGCSEPSEMTLPGSWSFSWKPVLELARDEAREAELKPSRRLSVSSGPPGTDDDVGRDESFSWCDAGRAKGFLKAGVSLWLEAAVEVRRWPRLGMPLTLREEARGFRADAELADAAAGAAAAGLFARTSEALDVFFCSDEAVGREMDDSEGFLRSWSDDGGARSWDWLADWRRTGRREAGAGLGMPEGRAKGDDEGCSMVSQAVVHMQLMGGGPRAGGRRARGRLGQANTTDGRD